MTCPYGVLGNHKGLVPGDGMQIIATMLMGINRARSFLLTGEVIDAQHQHSPAIRVGRGTDQPQQRGPAC